MDQDPQTPEQKEAQELYELASSLVTKVDALTRASLDLARLRKEARLKTLTKTRNRLEQQSDANCIESLDLFKKETEKEIQALQDRVVHYEAELRDRHKGSVEHYENNWRTMSGLVNREYEAFVNKVTTNCTEYIERVMKLDKEQLSTALKEFDVEISKWLLPEEEPA